MNKEITISPRQIAQAVDNLLDEKIKLQQRIEKAIEITHKLLMNSADNRIIAKEEEMDYFDWLDRTLEEQLKILKGEDNER